MSLVAAFGPIWILTTVGYAARRLGLLGEDASSVLGRFVFNLAIPAALFLTVAAMPLSHIAGRSLIAFGASTVAVLATSWLGASRLFGRKPAERPIWGMAAGYVNSANLGIPIAQQVLGSVSFLAQVVLLQSLFVTPIILIALDLHAGTPAGPERLRRIASIPLRNPPILGSLFGVVWSAAHLSVPSAVGGSLSLLGAAAVPAALIALGASLHSDGSIQATSPAEISAITLLKLAVQPLVGFGIGLLLHLSHAQLLAVVVCAGLPSAQNTFIFAQEYGIGEALANRAVVITTTLSLGTLAAAAALLGAR